MPSSQNIETVPYRSRKKAQRPVVEYVDVQK